MKVVINACFGGFGLSHKAVMRYAELKGIKLFPFIDKTTKEIYKEKATLDNPTVLKHYTTKEVKDEKGLNKNYFDTDSIERDDPALIKVVEEMGEKANGYCAGLKIIEIPKGVKYVIEEYDGSEWVSEKHRTWR